MRASNAKGEQEDGDIRLVDGGVTVGWADVACLSDSYSNFIVGLDSVTMTRSDGTDSMTVHQNRMDRAGANAIQTGAK